MQIQSQPVTSQQIREQNILNVRRALHSEQVATISRLKTLTGLSVVTLTKLLQYLIETGEVLEGESISIGNGRPAATYRFNASYRLILIVSCYKRAGHDYAGYSVHDLFGECIERREELLSKVHTDEFRIGIERYLDRHSKISIIGISMPTDTVGGRLASAVRHDPQAKRLSKHLELHFNVPVFFETDINAATLGCFNRHVKHNYVAGLLLVPGRAPVCGFCYQGNVLRGRDGMAGEVRFFPMFNDVGVLPLEPLAADDLAIRTLRAVMCVLNPSLVVVYSENLKSGFLERVKKQLSTEAEIALLPRLEINDHIREDIVSGMLTISLERMQTL